MYGIDISNYQSKIDLSKGNIDFVIMKASEGQNFVDKSLINFVDQIGELDKEMLVGFYHYVRPDIYGTVAGMKKEASHFVTTVQSTGLLNKSILVMDWEKEPFDREDLVAAWLEEVESLSGQIPFIYGSRSKLSNWLTWDLFSDYPIWMASWPNSKRVMAGENAGYTLPEKNIPWRIWQYSATGMFPGYSGNIDLDYTDIDRGEWRAYAGMTIENKVEELSEDMKWAIEKGLFVGYGDGTYGPKEPLTREQGASLFRRFSEWK